MNVIESKTLILRPITADDTPDILRWRNAEHVRRNFIYQKEVTLEDHQKWLTEKVASGKVIQFVMIDRSTGKGIGSVYLRDVDLSDKSAEYGIFIGEESALGKGFGSEAANLMVNFAFQTLKLSHLQLRVLARNHSAMRSYEKAGFCLIPERSDETVIDGKQEKIVFYQIDAKEF